MIFNITDVNLNINETKILKNINLAFEEKKFNAIIGPNGCGKSSLIKIIAKINKDYEGKILFLNQELEKIKRKDYAKQIAFFFQFNNDNLDLNVEQLVSFGRSTYKKLYQSLDSYDLQVIDDSIKKCDLENFRYRNLSSLSGGERQRVYLALVIAQEPDIIVLDEPTNHLDIKYQYQLLSLIKQLKEEKDLSIICILHDFNQVFKYADNTVIMNNGEVYVSGKTPEVITVENVKNVFGVDSIIHTDGNGYHIDFIV